jgi:hypothetical protein
MTLEGIEPLVSDEAPLSPDGGPGNSSPDDTAAATQTACCPIVGIGASAGELEAFQNFLAAAPPGSGLAYVLIQHLDPNHKSVLSSFPAGAPRCRCVRSATAWRSARTRLIRNAIVYGLQDRCDYEISPIGVSCRLSAPF